MTAPRAVGVRLPHEAVPAGVRAWVEAELGSPVVATAEQVGGTSPGCATRLTCADGTRVLVKAVGSDLNPDTPGLFRREIEVLRHLGEHELWARLLASYDDGAWVAMLIEDVDGRHPDFGDPAELDAVLPGFAAHLAVRSVVAVDVNLPTLNDFRIRESRRMLEAVARRSGR